MKNKRKQFPHLGKLSVAFLEAGLKRVIGDEPIKELRKPMEEERLQKSLTDIMVRTEKRFIEEYSDKDIGKAILDLPLADLPSLHEPIRSFYDNPSNNTLKKSLENQLKSDFPNLSQEHIQMAVSEYLRILQEELVVVDDVIRNKMVALEILAIRKKIDEVAEGDSLYKKYAHTTKLSQYIRLREFETLVNDRTRDFIGRDFIFKRIESIINDPNFPSGYIIVSGEPGIGKTAVIAQLVKTGGFIHHFNISLQNIKSPQDFLSNICAQIIVKYDLNHSDLPKSALKDSGFLVQLLVEAAEKNPNSRIVILIDALDEVEESGKLSSSNCLYLPPTLPNRVFVIATTRPQKEYIWSVDNQKDIVIQENDFANQEDVKNFIHFFITRHNKEMNRVIGWWGVDENKFTEILGQKSEGNFMYLVHVLNDIREGRLTAKNINKIENLPVGLRNYYRRHWHIMKDANEDKFKEYQMPIICLLATVKEPVPIEQLAEWTDLSPIDIKSVINSWREFLNEDKRDDGRLAYRIYHASFQDFLREEIGLSIYHNLIVNKAFRKIDWTSKSNR